LKNQLKSLRPPKAGGESTAKAMTQLNLLIHQHWKYMEEFDQRKVTPTGLRSIKDNTPSKMNMWWHFSTCSTKTTSSSCQS